jgi:acid phosphatase (class A)
MRRLLWLSPFVVVAFLGAIPVFAENAAAPATDYLAPGQIDLLPLLPPPPAPNSTAQKRDMQTMLDAQRHRTAAQTAQVEADAQITVFRFADVLGPNFTKDKLPKLTAFFDRVRHSESPIVGAVKDYWHRSRPFEADARIHPAPGLQEGVTNKDGTYNASYPSGHSTFGATCAILLAQMVPEKRSELFARGWEFGQNRVIGGVHYPTDVETGRIDATVLVYAMMNNPQFQHDFTQAKAELRAALGLTP